MKTIHMYAVVCRKNGQAEYFPKLVDEQECDRITDELKSRGYEIDSVLVDLQMPPVESLQFDDKWNDVGALSATVEIESTLYKSQEEQDNCPFTAVLNEMRSMTSEVTP